MVSKPDELPESIVLGQFLGIKNTVSPERLQLGELESAVDVDIDEVGQLRRRRGYDRIGNGRHHSLTKVAGRYFLVREDVLNELREGGQLGVGYNLTAMGFAGPEPISYTAVGAVIYFSSAVTSGKIVGTARQAWGQIGGSGEWLSPVIRPTETLGAIRGKLVGPPPTATIVEYFKGRIYLANGNLLWATELYLYDLVDKTRNFIQFEHDITMVRAVGDGLYVGTTEQLFFLQGTFSQGLKRDVVIDAGVIPGSSVLIPTANVHPAARQQPVPEGDSPVFMTSAGICVGLDGGQVFNLTRGKVEFPGGVSAAALYREDQGANSYVAVVNSAGGPAANARIGDYADAEIVRASQGG